MTPVELSSSRPTPFISSLFIRGPMTAQCGKTQRTQLGLADPRVRTMAFRASEVRQDCSQDSPRGQRASHSRNSTHRLAATQGRSHTQTCACCSVLRCQCECASLDQTARERTFRCGCTIAEWFDKFFNECVRLAVRHGWCLPVDALNVDNSLGVIKGVMYIIPLSSRSR